MPSDCESKVRVTESEYLKAHELAKDYVNVARKAPVWVARIR